jgi:N-acetylglucosaminyldiphosphoundecaprenol N-acetyl-beta-D-mannosaminyltransferase
MECPEIQMLGTHIHCLSMEDVLQIVDDAIATREPLLIGVVNAAKLVNMRHDEYLRESVTSADLVIADGMAVVWASKLLRRPLPERVAGIDIMLRILERGSTKKYRVFCLGAKPEILERTVKAIEEEFPGVVMAGSHHGYFDSDDEPGIVAQICESRADVIFVGISSPKKERFLARWRQEMAVPVCHGVGGSFDVIAGEVTRAPPRWQKVGAEWLWRLKQEPRRMWRRYLITNTLFGAHILKEVIHRR